MNAVSAQGPVRGPALVAPERRSAPAREAVLPRIPSRRPIGSGVRSVVLTRPARTAPRRIAPVAARPKAMKRPALYVTSFFALVLTSIAAVSIGASMDSPRTLMSPGDYSAGKRAIESQSRLSLGRCRGLAAAEKDVCRAEVRAVERVQKAELAARYHGTVAANVDVRNARVKATYEVARARCASRTAEFRMDCLRAAREERNRQVAQAAPATT
jgi:hypothetical protein